MARILFLPLLLVILMIVVFLVLHLRSMIKFSKSKDIVLQRPDPYPSDTMSLVNDMLKSLKTLSTVEYQSIIHVNYRRVTSFSRIGNTETGYSKIRSKSDLFEINRDDGNILIKMGKSESISIPRDNQWLDFWCGISPLEENIRLFQEEGMKLMAGNTGTYMQRKYTEILVLSHSISSRPNQAFESCSVFNDKIYGKKLSGRNLNIKNMMVRILVNNLTYLPDYVETKFNVFSGDEFICDYLQNSRLLY